MIAAVTVAEPRARVRALPGPGARVPARGASAPSTTRRTRCPTCCSRSPPVAPSPGRWSRCSPCRCPARCARTSTRSRRRRSAGRCWSSCRSAPPSRRCSGLIASAWPEQLDDAERDLLQYFIAVFAVQVPMYGVAVLLYAVLQAHKRFFWPAFAPVLSSLVVIATYLVYAALADGELDDPAAVAAGRSPSLGWGTTLGVAAMCFPMFVPGAPPRRPDPPDAAVPAGRRPPAGRLAFAGVGSLVAQQLSVAGGLVVASARGSVRHVVGLPLVAAGVPAAVRGARRPARHLDVPAARGRAPRPASTGVRADGVRDHPRGAGRGRAGRRRARGGGPGRHRHLRRRSPTAGRACRAMTTTITWMMPGPPRLRADVPRLARAVRPRARPVGDRRQRRRAGAPSRWRPRVLAAALAPAGHDPAATLARARAASSLGMLVGGPLAVVLLRRAAGRAATAGLARAAVVLVVGAGLGASRAGGWWTRSPSWPATAVLTAIGAAAGGGDHRGARRRRRRARRGPRRRCGTSGSLEAQPRPPVDVRVTDPANPNAPLS